MSLSLKIFTAFGIPVQLHISMLIVPFLALNWVDGYGAMSLFVAGMGVIVVFGSILLHELGHALTARKFGVHTKDIVLTPIGGMARILNMPTKPSQEILISAAGPAVSFALAILGFVVLYVAAPFGGPQLVMDGLGVLFWINLMLGAFNLIPALPMDGGRILRGILATRNDYLTATRKAAKVGKILAVVGFSIGGIALLGRFVGFSIGVSPWSILLISAFVYFSAGQEERMAARREAQRQGASGGGPFRWAWTRGANPGPSPSQGHGQPGSGWTSSTDPRNGGAADPRSTPPRSAGPKVVVVQGGKAEVISRKDPKN